MQTNNFIMMPIPIESYAAVCALIAAGAGMNVAIPAGNANRAAGGDARPANHPSLVNAGGSAESSAPADTGVVATTESSPSDNGEVDAHGWPWSADLHASTKGKTKDGLWRMKVGVSRPDPKPGFPVEEATGTQAAGTEAPATPSATTAPASSPAPTTEEEDEFAAFRAAAGASDAADAAAAASVPERQYSDADLGALCNQAAVKLGDPSPIKEIIASYTPEGQVAHSRNIPADKRAEFVKAVEEKAGIQFAG